MDFLPIPARRCAWYLERLLGRLERIRGAPEDTEDVRKAREFALACLMFTKTNPKALERCPFAFWGLILAAIEEVGGDDQDYQSVKDWIENVLGVECQTTRR